MSTSGTPSIRTITTGESTPNNPDSTTGRPSTRLSTAIYSTAVQNDIQETEEGRRNMRKTNGLPPLHHILPGPIINLHPWLSLRF